MPAGLSTPTATFQVTCCLNDNCLVTVLFVLLLCYFVSFCVICLVTALFVHCVICLATVLFVSLLCYCLVTVIFVSPLCYLCLDDLNHVCLLTCSA